MPSMTSQSSTTSQTSAAPVRDFQRVANSIHREAVPAGVFTGKSKQLYDCLYSLTRGAITPTRSVRISRPKLMKRAHIGARTTFDTNVERLVAAGLLQVRKIAGEHDGNEYTVFTPDEVSMTSQGSHTSQTSPAQNPDRLDGLESSQTRHTLSADFQRTSEIPNTSSKTNTKDDDDVMPLLRVRAGKPMPKTEAVLLSLLDTLEARTGGDITSPDALLAHVLHQKLAPRGKSAQRRPSEGQFRDRPVVIEVTDEDLAEYERNRAELAGD
jgi:hypothetical protein